MTAEGKSNFIEGWATKKIRDRQKYLVSKVIANSYKIKYNLYNLG